MTEICSSFIDGGWTDGAGAHRIPVISPIDESEVAQIAEADAAEVDRAVKAARAAFERGEWRRAPVAKRQIRERHVRRAAGNFKFFADFIGQTSNESYEQDAPFLTIVRRGPVGVAALVAPMATWSRAIGG